MELITENIGEVLLNQLQNLEELKIAVAYFDPRSKRLLDELEKVSNLTLIVSDDFTAVNPYTLQELLNRGKNVKSVDSGKNNLLHSKVYYAVRKDNSYFLIVSSANMTRNGLYNNNEASILLDSKIDDIKKIKDSTIKWFSEIEKKSEKMDFESKYSIWDERNKTSKNKPGLAEENFWILKTRGGGLDEFDNWSKFKEEGVVAIGWGEDLTIRTPSEENKEKMTKEILENIKKYNKQKAAASVIYSEIKAFFSMKVGDTIIIMDGITPNQKKEVRIMGVATVTKFIGEDSKSDWWIYKHKVEIVDFKEKYFPVNEIKEALNLGSCMRTIHSIKSERYRLFSNYLLTKHNINLGY
ncbi:MAG: phospholipase D family protein [Melioribacteraceae bacterium]|nr:phospholipase D family protein [Melioribacteraceae bacterium]